MSKKNTPKKRNSFGLFERAKLAFRSLPKSYYKAQQETESHIWTLRGVALGLFLIIAGGLWSISKIPDHILLYDTPSLATGSTRKINEVPQYTAYSFALYIWQQINTMDNVAAEYEDNVTTKYSAYIEPEFQNHLVALFKQDRGEKNGISRRIIEKQSANWTDANRIVDLGGGKWVVFLDISLEEHLNGHLVRDVDFRYPIIVKKADFNVEKNPMGLVLDSYYSPVTRLTKEGL